MLKSILLHPEILSVLASCGHKAKVMIADANYSIATNTSACSKKVFLNLKPGTVSIPEILEVILTTINIEAVEVMEVPEGEVAEIHKDFEQILPEGTEMKSLERYAFYDAVKSSDTALVIASGDQRRFANLLLTVGVVKS